MDLDLLDLYRRASEWTSTKVAGAVTKLDAPTSCDGWNVRTLMSHMLETQKYFVGAARGEDVRPRQARHRTSSAMTRSQTSTAPAPRH